MNRMEGRIRKQGHYREVAMVGRCSLLLNSFYAIHVSIEVLH